MADACRDKPDAPQQYSVAEVLHTLRLEAGITQRQLAERLEVSQTWVYARERGKARIEVGDFIEWCQACGIKPEAGFDRLLVVSGGAKQ